MTLYTNENLTLAFAGMTESDPQTLAEMISIDSLVRISMESEDQCERSKAAKAIDIAGRDIQKASLFELVNSLTTQLRAEQLESARLRNLIKIGGGVR